MEKAAWTWLQRSSGSTRCCTVSGNLLPFIMALAISSELMISDLLSSSRASYVAGSLFVLEQSHQPWWVAWGCKCGSLIVSCSSSPGFLAESPSGGCHNNPDIVNNFGISSSLCSLQGMSPSMAEGICSKAGVNPSSDMQSMIDRSWQLLHTEWINWVRVLESGSFAPTMAPGPEGKVSVIGAHKDGIQGSALELIDTYYRMPEVCLWETYPADFCIRWPTISGTYIPTSTGKALQWLLRCPSVHNGRHRNIPPPPPPPPSRVPRPMGLGLHEGSTLFCSCLIVGGSFALQEEDIFGKLLNRVNGNVQKAVKKLQNKRVALKKQLDQVELADTHQKQGDLIVANLYKSVSFAKPFQTRIAILRSADMP